MPRKKRNKASGQPATPEPAAPQTIAFEYIKAQQFRVVHADGAIGGVTPSGNVHVAFYSERPAIPRMMVHRRNENGTLGQPIAEQTVARAGVIREMDVDVVMSPTAVDSLLNWLQERRGELEIWKKQYDAVQAELGKKK